MYKRSLDKKITVVLSYHSVQKSYTGYKMIKPAWPCTKVLLDLRYCKGLTVQASLAWSFCTLHMICVLSRYTAADEPTNIRSLFITCTLRWSWNDKLVWFLHSNVLFAIASFSMSRTLAFEPGKSFCSWKALANFPASFSWFSLKGMRVYIMSRTVVHAIFKAVWTMRRIICKKFVFWPTLVM